MLPNTIFQLLTIGADIIIFIFVWFYMWEIRTKDKSLEDERKKTDSNYHHVVDDALAKERKIIDDATKEATHIISQTEFLTDASKESVDQALKKMEGEIEKEAGSTSQTFSKTYSASLQKLASQSLTEFQNITRVMETDLQKQSQQFRDAMLPSLQKELEEYKTMRLQQTERTITHIIQEVSQEILNKAISLDDHERLLTESLEKAKKEGVFD